MSYSDLPCGLGTIALPATYPQFNGYYPQCEMAHKQFWIETARPDWVILDIGANVGIFSILFAKLGAKVYAFEPVAETLEKLRENIGANNTSAAIEVVPLAVSNRSGVIKEKIYSIWEHEVQDKEFTFITVDDWIEARGLTVAALKVDVDGFDYEVLLGAEKTLRAQRPLVVVEINAALSTRDVPLEAPRVFMAQLGYKARQIDADNVVFEFDDEK